MQIRGDDEEEKRWEGKERKLRRREGSENGENKVV